MNLGSDSFFNLPKDAIQMVVYHVLEKDEIVRPVNGVHHNPVIGKLEMTCRTSRVGMNALLENIYNIRISECLTSLQSAKQLSDQIRLGIDNGPKENESYLDWYKNIFPKIQQSIALSQSQVDFALLLQKRMAEVQIAKIKGEIN